MLYKLSFSYFLSFSELFQCSFKKNWTIHKSKGDRKNFNVSGKICKNTFENQNNILFPIVSRNEEFLIFENNFGVLFQIYCHKKNQLDFRVTKTAINLFKEIRNNFIVIAINEKNTIAVFLKIN